MLFNDTFFVIRRKPEMHIHAAAIHSEGEKINLSLVAIHIINLTLIKLIVD